MNVLELKEKHPSLFNKEHEKYCEGLSGDNWYDYLYEDFKDIWHEKYGIHVQEFRWAGFYSQGDGAAFTGTMPFAKFLELDGHADKYLALHLAAKSSSCEINIESGYRSRLTMRVNIEPPVGTSYPTGVFVHLPELAWDELVDEQWCARSWEDDVKEWLDRRADELYCALRDEYEHLCSAEQFIEFATWNELDFEGELS